jgi:hypothetical protein
MRSLRDTVTVASDLAVIGIMVCLLSLGILTVPAALRAGSVAVRAVIADPTQHGARVPFRLVLRVYRLSLVPGCAVSAVALLVLLDLGVVGRGWVPGGLPLTLAVGVAAATLATVGALTVVLLGHDPERSWRDGLRQAALTAWRRPVAAAAEVGVLAVAATIAVLIPLTAPLVVGFALFALHVVADRLSLVTPVPAPAEAPLPG